MNPFTRKTILPLEREQACATPIPLRAIYSLANARSLDDDPVRIESLSPREAFLELLRNAFNHRIVDAERLDRQFAVTGQWASVTRVQRVFYPRILDRLPEVCETLLCNVAGSIPIEIGEMGT